MLCHRICGQLQKCGQSSGGLDGNCGCVNIVDIVIEKVELASEC